jgi:hypothetical protein
MGNPVSWRSGDGNLGWFGSTGWRQPGDPHTLVHPGEVLRPSLLARIEQGRDCAGLRIDAVVTIGFQRIGLSTGGPEVVATSRTAARRGDEMLEFQWGTGDFLARPTVATAATGIG